MSTYHLQLSLTKKAGQYCLFSLPQSNHYQNITSITVRPKPYLTKRDQWGNEIIVIRLNDVSKTAEISGSYEPLTYRRSINPSWTMEDYRSAILKKYTYLFAPNRFVDGSNHSIRTITKSWKACPILNILEKSYGFVMNELTYGRPSTGLYTYQQALSDKVTDCGGFSSLLISLLLALNIPARLAVGFLLRPGTIKWSLTRLTSLFGLSFNSFYMHVWVEALLPDNSWFPMDPSIEWQRNNGATKSKGGFGYIPADRLAISYGQDFIVKIGQKKYVIDLLQHPVYL